MKLLVSLLLIVSFSFAQDDLAKGKDAFAKKSYDDALQLFQKYLLANSRSAEANYYVGETYRLKVIFKAHKRRWNDPWILMMNLNRHWSLSSVCMGNWDYGIRRQNDIR